MRRLTRGGSVLLLVTLILALSGVAGASPRHAAGVDRGRDRNAQHQRARARARGDEGRHDRSRGTWTASPPPQAPGSAHITPATGMSTATVAAPVTAVPPAGGTSTPTVVVEASQPIGAAPVRQGPGTVAPIAHQRGLRPAGSGADRAAAAPWYLSLGAGLPLSSAFGAGELRAAVRLSVPVALAGIVLIFLIVQAQIDKRDPKLTEAPIRRTDDGMSFE